MDIKRPGGTRRSERHDGADRLPGVHQVEGLVDALERQLVGDQVVDVDLPFHVPVDDLRHVAASSLIASGLSVAVVQAVLGHATPAETLEVCTHLWPAEEDRMRQAIEDASTLWTGTAATASPIRAVSDWCHVRRDLPRIHWSGAVRW